MTDREVEADSPAGLARTDLAALLDAVADLLYVFSPDGDFRYWNDASVRTTGYGAEEIAAMSPLELFEEADREAVGEAIARVADEDDPVAVEADLVTKGGERVPYEFSGVRLGEDEGGEALIGWLGRDVSDRVQRERELRLQNERLEEFTTVVSHDLRNPLDVANARLELAATECDSEHIEVAIESLRRMADIVDDSLTLARQGQVVAEADWLDLEAAARDAWQQVETGPATLEVVDDAQLHADGDRIQHVFENLFRNAVQHGGEAVDVALGVTDDGFYVADDGRGIDPEDRETVFEPGETDAPDGTGFGLSIVRRVAEAHGWEVGVTDSEDGGARFEFSEVPTRPA